MQLGAPPSAREPTQEQQAIPSFAPSRLRVERVASLARANGLHDPTRHGAVRRQWEEQFDAPLQRRRKIFATPANFDRANFTRETFLYYVDLLRDSSWSSEAEASICISGTAPLGYESFADVKSGAVTHWIEEIKKVWAHGAGITLDLARVVSAAKTRLCRQYGQWSQLWKSGQKLPISKSTADRLALIGDRMGDLDSATSLNLPRGWNILHCLARLDRGKLEQLIHQGVVHPQLTLRQARELVAQFTRKTLKSRAARVLLQARLRRFAEFVATHLPDWGPHERELATEELARLIERIGASGGDVFERTGKSRTFTNQRDILTDQPNNL